MKEFITFSVLGLLVITTQTTVLAQPGIDWSRELDDSLLIYPTCLALGHNGLIAIGGEVFADRNDSSDFYLRLIDQNGGPVASKSYQTEGWGATESVMDVLPFQEGYILSGSSYFNGLDRNSRWHLFRVDADGDTIWHRIYEEYADWIKAIIVGDNIYVAGAGDRDNDSCQLVVRKINSQGETIWTQSHWIDDVYELWIVSVIQSSPFLAISGNTESNCFLASIDDEGRLWDFQIFRSDLERYYACDLINPEIHDLNSLIYIGGFHPSQNFNNYNIHAYDTRGMWRTVITDFEGYNYPAAAIPIENGFIVAGSIQNGLDEENDFFLARLDFQGAIQWSTSFETEGNDWCRDVIALSDGSYLIVSSGYPSKLLKTTPDPLSTGNPDFNPHPASLILSAFPSPFNSSTFVSFRTPFAGDFKASLTDFAGRELRNLIPASAGMRAGMPGEVRFLVDGSGLSAGTYWLKVEQNGQAAATRLVLVR